MNKKQYRPNPLHRGVAALLAGALLAGCSSAPSSSAPGNTAAQPATAEVAQTAETAATATAAGQDSWTVLVYLCGSNLESGDGSATLNLTEIAQTLPNDQVNVVLETGGSEAWHAEELGLEIPTDTLARWQYDANGYTLLETQPLATMAAADTLTDFVRWGAQNYPADKYLLVMWDHGGGSLNGITYDELHPNGSATSLEELARALKNADVPLEAVLMDACLMATLENAQFLAPYARYLIASEETVPGAGTAYSEWLQYLYDDPDCTGDMLGKVVCTSTLQKYANQGFNTVTDSLTFSCIDLSKIEAVSVAFDALFREVNDLLDDAEAFSTFSYSISHVQRFYTTSMVDLKDMAQRARSIGVVSVATANAVRNAVDAAVVHNVVGTNRSFANGLSFYYQPSATVSNLDHYARNCKSAVYLAFLDRASIAWTAPEWVYEQVERRPDVTDEGYHIMTQVDLAEDGQLQLTVSSGKQSVSSVQLRLLRYDEEEDAWLYLGRDPGVQGDFDTGIFTSDFDGTWFSLDDTLCQLNLVEETETYELYSVPLYDVEDECIWDMRVAYIYDTPLTQQQGGGNNTETIDYSGTYQIYGLWDSGTSSAETPARNVLPIEVLNGTEIAPAFSVVEISGTSATTTTYRCWNDSIIAGGEMTFGKTTLPPGEYKAAFVITDTLERQIITPQVDLYLDYDGFAFDLGGEEETPDIATPETAA